MAWRYAGLRATSVQVCLRLASTGSSYGYSVGRFYVEGVRTDSLAFTGPDWLASFLRALWSPMNFFGWGTMEIGKNIRTSQLMAILIIVAAISFILIRRNSKSDISRYSAQIEKEQNQMETSTLILD